MLVRSGEKWLSLLEDICEKNISMLLSAAVEAWRAQPHEKKKRTIETSEVICRESRALRLVKFIQALIKRRWPFSRPFPKPRAAAIIPSPTRHEPMPVPKPRKSVYCVAIQTRKPNKSAMPSLKQVSMSIPRHIASWSSCDNRSRVDEEKVFGVSIFVSVRNLNDEQFLHVLAGAAFAHAVPRSVGKAGADGPHDGYGGFSTTYDAVSGRSVHLSCDADILGRSVWAAISMTRAALLEELDELERKVAGKARLTAKAVVVGTRVAMRASIMLIVGSQIARCRAKTEVYVRATSDAETAEWCLTA
jgi:hypothetical protein